MKVYLNFLDLIKNFSSDIYYWIDKFLNINS